jgi:hypothetical protein
VGIADLDDPDGGTFTGDSDDDPSGGFTIVTDFGGEVTMQTDGTFTYVANSEFIDALGDEDVEDTFQYTIEDEFGLSDTATVHVTINGENDPPVARDDTYELTGSGTTFNLDSILTHADIDLGETIDDSDVDNVVPDEMTVFQLRFWDGSATRTAEDGGTFDADGTLDGFITVELHNHPHNGLSGTVVMDTSDGTFTYTANAEFLEDELEEDGTFEDTFDYRIQDPDGANSNWATVDLVKSEASILNATIKTNTNVQDQQVLLTFTQISNPMLTFTTLITLPSQGQENNILRDVGFDIEPSEPFLVTLHHVGSTKVIITDFSVEGVLIHGGPGSGNLQLANDDDIETGPEHHGLSAVIQPDQLAGTDGLISGPVESNDLATDFASSSTSPEMVGPTDPLDSGGIPFTYGDGGDDTLQIVETDPTVEILDGGPGNDNLLGGEGQSFLFGEAGADTLRGADGDDLLMGGDGGDILQGDAGDDVLFGGADSDNFEFNSGDLGNGVDKIMDFSGFGGDDDIIDISDVIAATNSSDKTYSALTGEGYIQFATTDGDLDGANDDTMVKIDLDGNGAGSAVDLVIVMNVSPGTLDNSSNFDII